MALFSRRKAAAGDAANEAPETPAPDVTAVAEEAAPEVSAEPTPHVGISVTSFGGLGAPSRPAPAAPPAQPQGPGAGLPVRPAETGAPLGLPFAPMDPPTEWFSIDGLRDNAVLRDALARLGESPTGTELLGVARQMLQGHMFLRVKGDAREQLAKGEPLALGVVRDGERAFVLAFSSGTALKAAVESDKDTATSAVAQPSELIIQHMLAGDFAGIVLDNHSAPARAVLPRDLIERAIEQADPGFRLKSLVAGERTPETAEQIVAAMAEAKMFVAIGKAGENDGQPVFGVAEVRTAAGERMLQLFTHPLEVAALGRDEQAAPFSAEQLKAAMTATEDLAGVLIDTAGPGFVLSRAQLAPLLQD